MSAPDIPQNLISRLGQSQADRLPVELGVHFFDVDERTPEHLLAQTRALATFLRFYPPNTGDHTENWSAFFPDQGAAWLDAVDGNVPPHFGLYASFLELYRHPQRLLNSLTGMHLDFQFQRVLQFQPRPAKPDHAHLVLELKKGAESTVVTPDQTFSAGKDVSQVELIYRPVRDVVVNQGAVVDLRSVFVDAAGIHFAPIANSANGLGGPLDPLHPHWLAFGAAALPMAQIGFAVAAPVLRMQEGQRRITLELQLGATDVTEHSPAALAQAFLAYVSGPTGWLGPYPITGTAEGSKTRFMFALSATDPAVVDYHSAIHGHVFATQSPVVQILLNPNSKNELAKYGQLRSLTVSTIQISVEVDGLTTLQLENDFGTLNAKKPFQPFGPQPVRGSRFLIGSDEALSKRLSELTIQLTWHGAPTNLADWYKDYTNVPSVKDGISADLVYQDARGNLASATLPLLRGTNDGTSTLKVTSGFAASTIIREDERLFGLLHTDTNVTREVGLQMMRRLPIRARSFVPPPEARSGFITISLREDFLHTDYRKETLANAFKRFSERKSLAEPYTPTIRSIRLNYRAASEKVDMSSTSESSFVNPDVQFFHVGCFGQMREHGYLRAKTPELSATRIPLLPDYPDEGELLIGVKDVTAGDSLSLLFQVAEGSDAPGVTLEGLAWSVLSNNRWRLLTPQELNVDTTNLFRTSGIVALTLPKESTTENTILPTGLLWLRASVRRNTAGACKLIQVANNAVEVRFVDQNNDPAHLTQALEAKRISKLKTPLAVIKTVSQPFGSFGGQVQESSELLTRRAAERLRHRNRCITPWDYERLLLEEFPEIHKVKCIPHANGDSWKAAGHVLLVVIPDLRNKNLVDTFQPKVNSDTLAKMTAIARHRCGMQLVVNVRNPQYQRVLLDFKVRFKPGFPFNLYQQKLNEALLQALAPWAYNVSQPIEFGGQVYRSVLLNYVEQLPYVDFVTEFKLLVSNSNVDVPEVRASRPDAILVPELIHLIREV